jgi:hypothetical protein
MTTRLVDLNALVADQRVKLGDIEYPVKAASAIVAKLAESMTEENRIELAIDIVRKVCPTMPPEVLEDLTIVQLMAILTLSAEAVTIVQDSDPNAVGPTTANSSPA